MIGVPSIPGRAAVIRVYPPTGKRLFAIASAAESGTKSRLSSDLGKTGESERCT